MVRYFSSGVTTLRKEPLPLHGQSKQSVHYIELLTILGFIQITTVHM